MNIEELKLILETVKTVSSDVSDIALWWVIAQYVALPILEFVRTIFALSAGAYVILKLAKYWADSSAASEGWEKIGRDVSKAWGGSGGEYSYNNDSEIAAINKAIQAAKDKK